LGTDLDHLVPAGDEEEGHRSQHQRDTGEDRHASPTWPAAIFGSAVVELAEGFGRIDLGSQFVEHRS
jgi:hypothetical protein